MITLIGILVGLLVFVLFSPVRIQPMDARLASPLAHQALGSLCFVCPIQPLDLPYTHTQHPGCFFLRQPLVFDPLHDF